MRKLLRSLGLGAAFAVGAFGTLALAQVITTSVQLSQDARGVLGLDAAQNLYIQASKHLLANTVGGGSLPALSSCGTSPSITGTDFSFKLVTGGTATTCTITFATAFATAPQCFLQANGGATEPTYTTSTTALTVTVDIASTTYSGLCISVS